MEKDKHFNWTLGIIFTLIIGSMLFFDSSDSPTGMITVTIGDNAPAQPAAQSTGDTITRQTITSSPDYREVKFDNTIVGYADKKNNFWRSTDDTRNAYRSTGTITPVSAYSMRVREPTGEKGRYTYRYYGPGTSERGAIPGDNNRYNLQFGDATVEATVHGDGTIRTYRDDEVETVIRPTDSGQYYATTTKSDGSVTYGQFNPATGEVTDTQEFESCVDTAEGMLCSDGEDDFLIGADGKAVATALSEALAWFGQMLQGLATATSGYSGVSFFYDEPDPLTSLDESMSNYLGGIDGWSSEICKTKLTDASSLGAAFSTRFDGGAFAFVQGERIEYVNYNTSTPTNNYLYKFGFKVDPGDDSYGCDIDFEVVVDGQPVFKDSITSGSYLFKAKRDDGGTVDYSGQNSIVTQSSTRYEQICMKFKKIQPEFNTQSGGTTTRCLVGVEQGDTICKKLNEKTTVESADDSCDSGLSTLFFPACWGGYSGSGSGGSSGGSVGSSGTATSEPLLAI